MKRLLPKLWAQITAVSLFILAAVLMLYSGAAVAYLAINDAYIDDGLALRREMVSSSLFWEKMEMAYAGYQNMLDIHSMAALQNNSTVEETDTMDIVYDAVPKTDIETSGVSLDAAVDMDPYYEEKFSEETSNFFFTVTDLEGHELYNSFYTPDYQYTASSNYEVIFDRCRVDEVLSFETYQERWQYIQKCEAEHHDVNYKYWDEDTDGDGDYECVLQIIYSSGEKQTVIITGYVKSSFTAMDEFYNAGYWLDMFVNARFKLIFLFALLVILSAVLFVFIICAAGHKEDDDGIHLTWIDKIPFDIHVALVCAAFIFSILAISDGLNSHLVTLLFTVFAGVISFTALALSFAVRIKKGEWWKNTLIFRLISFLIRVFKWFNRLFLHIIRALSLFWKTLIVYLGISLTELFVIMIYYPYVEVMFVFWLIEKLVIAALLALVVINMRKLQKGAAEIASGNLNYKLDFDYMFGEFKEHAENLNSINKGMNTALEEQLKSERLKTELITNVSHDIKTPLTSIVNYVDLLKKEGGGSEKSQEYISIIERQSHRLKKLTEDLLEAAKTSTGNITVTMDRVNVNLLLNQAAGEYEDRLLANNLSLVIDLPEELPYVHADGKLLWRVFDNLLSNICKYSLSGTRVYVTAEYDSDRVGIIFKNISNYPLNISSDELMERFVRGDSSRSTEGSGLGLSIARSLTELQNGIFDIIIDGDLFKAVTVFSVYK